MPKDTSPQRHRSSGRLLRAAMFAGAIAALLSACETIPGSTKPLSFTELAAMQHYNPGKSPAALQEIWNGMSLGDQDELVDNYKSARLAALTPKLPPYDPNAALGDLIKKQEKERMGGGNGGGGGGGGSH